MGLKLKGHGPYEGDTRNHAELDSGSNGKRNFELEKCGLSKRQSASIKVQLTHNVEQKECLVRSGMGLWGGGG